MRAILQRVSRATVTVEETNVGEIQAGWLVFLGVARQDLDDDLDYIVDKISNLRAFPDADGKMNRSILDIAGKVLLVSQFTLYGDCRKGRRPSFGEAAPPDQAKSVYEECARRLQSVGLEVACGQFQAMMQVALVNDGPVTFILDSSRQI